MKYVFILKLIKRSFLIFKNCGIFYCIDYDDKFLIEMWGNVIWMFIILW